MAVGRSANCVSRSPRRTPPASVSASRNTNSSAKRYAAPGKGGATRLDEEVAVVDLVRRRRDRDAAMTLACEPVDRLLGDTFEIKIEP